MKDISQKRKKTVLPIKELKFRFFDFRYFKKKDHNRINKWSILGFEK